MKISYFPLQSTYYRVRRWFSKSAHDRRIGMRWRLQRTFGCVFALGFSKIGALFIAYHPDSHYVFSSFPEFDGLFRKFVSDSKQNHGGDITRLWSLILNIKQIINEGIEGDFAELGVFRGNTASILANYGIQNKRNIFLFDTYEGFDRRDIVGHDNDKVVMFSDTTLPAVQRLVGADSEFIHYVKGYFPNSIIDEHRKRRYAVVSLDCDLYEPMKAGLNFFYPRMTRGGILLLHDYSNCGWIGAKMAIDEFCKENAEFIVLMPDKSGSAFLRKSR
jgi:Macrocin-O-methyltransferase (TylF)